MFALSVSLLTTECIQEFHNCGNNEKDQCYAEYFSHCNSLSAGKEVTWSWLIRQAGSLRSTPVSSTTTRDDFFNVLFRALQEFPSEIFLPLYRIFSRPIDVMGFRNGGYGGINATNVALWDGRGDHFSSRAYGFWQSTNLDAKASRTSSQEQPVTNQYRSYEQHRISKEHHNGATLWFATSNFLTLTNVTP